MISTVPKIVKFLVLAAALASVSAVATADDAERQKTEEEMKKYRFKTVTTPEGLNFNVPEDMPIETRNGLKAPIPYDEYLYFRFKKLEEKLEENSAKLDKMAAQMEKVQSSLEALQKKSSAPRSS